MPTLSPTLHTAIDYVSVLIFAAAPSLLGFEGLDATVCYALAGAHLIVTLVTAAPGSLAELLPYPFHGVIERVVGVTLIVAPWLAGDAFSADGRVFFTAIGVVLLVVGWMTDYHARDAAAAEGQAP